MMSLTVGLTNEEFQEVKTKFDLKKSYKGEAIFRMRSPDDSLTTFQLYHLIFRNDSDAIYFKMEYQDAFDRRQKALDHEKAKLGLFIYSEDRSLYRKH